jgi:type 1 glutamine amidotransferase
MWNKMILAALAAVPALATGQTGNPGGPINDRLGKVDYGVCRGLDARCFRDWKRSPASRRRILLYTRTAGPRHAALGPALGAGLNPALGADNVAQVEMLRIARENGWDVDYTEDVAQMVNLTGYDAVVFLSTSRDNLDDNAKSALRQYMRAGGGFVGIHNAFGTLYNWPYYEGLLGGANFYDHGPYRAGNVVIRSPGDSSVSGLPRRFRMADEWYNLVPFPTGVRFLATVDEKSWGAPIEQPRPPRAAMPAGFAPRLPSVVGKHPGHGDFHPVAWCQYYDGGKAWVTTLGHDARAFRKGSDFEGGEQFQKLIVGGIKSVMGDASFCRA